MNLLNRKNVALKNNLPIRILQFGEGNFLRAFVGYAFQKLNEEANFNAGIALVQPIEKGLVHLLNDQDGLYTLFMKGIKKGKEIQDIKLISNIVKGVDPYSDFNAYLDLAKVETLEFVISNTTEAGIAYDASDTADMRPPKSFPAKLTVFLFERFKHFKGDPSKGLTLIPCELINHNAENLKEIILQYTSDWDLGDAFKTWILEHNAFHSTLVDRIVPGYPKDDIEAYNEPLDYVDQLIVAAEVFFLWVIEGGAELKAKLPFEKTGLDVKIVNDMQPYRTRKVRILNGAHTAMVPISILYGNTTVKQSVDDDFTGAFINKALFDEIIPTLPMDTSELQDFAAEVLDRFRNPFIKHQLSDIALNSISKFKVRVLPSILAYIEKQNKVPIHLTFAFACLIRFYKGTWQGHTLPIKDSLAVTDFFTRTWKDNNYGNIAKNVLANRDFWDQDLSEIKKLSKATAIALEEIDKHGISLGFSNFHTLLSK